MIHPGRVVSRVPVSVAATFTDVPVSHSVLLNTPAA